MSMAMSAWEVSASEKRARRDRGCPKIDMNYKPPDALSVDADFSAVCVVVACSR